MRLFPRRLRSDSQSIFDNESRLCFPDFPSSYESTVFHVFVSSTLGVLLGLCFVLILVVGLKELDIFIRLSCIFYAVALASSSSIIVWSWSRSQTETNKSLMATDPRIVNAILYLSALFCLSNIIITITRLVGFDAPPLSSEIVGLALGMGLPTWALYIYKERLAKSLHTSCLLIDGEICLYVAIFSLYMPVDIIFCRFSDFSFLLASVVAIILSLMMLLQARDMKLYVEYSTEGYQVLSELTVPLEVSVHDLTNSWSEENLSPTALRTI